MKTSHDPSGKVNTKIMQAAETLEEVEPGIYRIEVLGDRRRCGTEHSGAVPTVIRLWVPR